MIWDDDMVRRCVALRQAGRTYDAIAAELGVSRGAVAGCLRRHRKNPSVCGTDYGRSEPKVARRPVQVSAAVADLLKKLVIAGTELKQARFGPGERAKTIAFQKAAEALVDRLWQAQRRRAEKGGEAHSPIPKSNPKEIVR